MNPSFCLGAKLVAFDVLADVVLVPVELLAVLLVDDDVVELWITEPVLWALWLFMSFCCRSSLNFEPGINLIDVRLGQSMNTSLPASDTDVGMVISRRAVFLNRR